MVTSTRTARSRTENASLPTRIVGAIRRRAFLAIVLALYALLISSEGYLGRDRIQLVAGSAIGSQGFRLAAWEAQAIDQKVKDFFARPGDGLSPLHQRELVESYFDNIARADSLTAQIEAIHADPTQVNPAAAAGPLQTELDVLLREQDGRRPGVERILQEQVRDVLSAEGLTTIGRVWPPVLFQFTGSPDYLVISPRDRIATELGVFMNPGQSVPNKERVESQVEEQPNVSALVEETGGFSAYPTMVVAYSDMAWVVDTVAHEWTHTYLTFHPLGLHYFDDGETRTLNETTASIVGGEIGQGVLERFYPDRLPPPSPPTPPSATPSEQAPAKPAFSYGDTMRETRLHVDELLAKGRVAEAEEYMESQRRILVAHGYNIRKLNQAFFAFHGSYAVGPAATDPIGDKLRALRARSKTLADFVHTVSGVRNVKDLDALLAQPGS